jgi:hypothetical protein
MKLNNESKDKLSDVFIHLGEAAIIASAGSFFLGDIKWYFAIGGVIFGSVLILNGIIIANSIRKENSNA